MASRESSTVVGAQGLGARRKAAGQAAGRDLIYKVAEQLFLDRGFDAVTLDQVAAACGVSVRTVLRYFSSKEDLALAAFGAQFEKFRTGLSARTGNVLSYWREHVLANAARSAADQGAALKRTLKVVLDSPTLSAHLAAINHQYEAVLAQEIAAETGDEGFGPWLLASVLVAGNSAATQYWLAGRTDYDQKIFTAVIDYATETVPNLFPPATLSRRARKRDAS